MNLGVAETTLEVIQSRAILLDSRINLASSERKFFLYLNLIFLSSIGRLTAKQLNLKTVNIFSYLSKKTLIFKGFY